MFFFLAVIHLHPFVKLDLKFVSARFFLSISLHFLIYFSSFPPRPRIVLFMFLPLFNSPLFLIFASSFFSSISLFQQGFFFFFSTSYLLSRQYLFQYLISRQYLFYRCRSIRKSNKFHFLI